MNSTPNTPGEVINTTIHLASAKADAAPLRTFLLAVMAGAFIALGAQSSSLAVHSIGNVGLSRTLADCIFPVGLLMIVFVGGELFTGDCMMAMACMKKTLSFKRLVITLITVYFGNFCGGLLISTLAAYSGQFDYSSPGTALERFWLYFSRSGPLSYPVLNTAWQICNIFLPVSWPAEMSPIFRKPWNFSESPPVRQPLLTGPGCFYPT